MHETFPTAQYTLEGLFFVNWKIKYFEFTFNYKSYLNMYVLTCVNFKLWLIHVPLIIHKKVHKNSSQFKKTTPSRKKSLLERKPSSSTYNKILLSCNHITSPIINIENVPTKCRLHYFKIYAVWSKQHFETWRLIIVSSYPCMSSF